MPSGSASTRVLAAIDGFAALRRGWSMSMSSTHDRGPAPTRRDFISLSAGAFVAVGGAAAMWPFIDQMNPNPGTPLPSVVDLAPIEPGQAVTVAWRGLPVVVRHRTREEIERARNVPLHVLPDRDARNAALAPRAPASDDNRTLEGHPEWLVVIGVCTHMGCLLTMTDALQRGDGDEGWFCRCHAARFDLAGRLRSGPARTNLPVPPYRFAAPGRIEIGAT
jgi:ubiquinol-cytochrome c reductase iron-sulfur subunit